MGAAIDEELGERLLVTLVASRKANAEGGVRHAESQAGSGRGSDSVAAAYLAGIEMDSPTGGTSSKHASRYAAPAPESTPEKTERLLTQQGVGRGRKAGSRMKQVQLPLEIISRGRFEKSEPTICNGQDLDVPTYIRRGVALN